MVNECQVVRKGSHIETPRLHRSKADNEVEQLINIETHDENYWLANPSTDPLTSKEFYTWILLNNHNEGKGAELHEGDVIRMGACSFLVKKLVFVSPAAGVLKNNMESKYLISPVEDSGVEIKCRICFSEENTRDEPIITSPCECSGSIKYIHLTCLRQWLRNQLIERKNEYFHSYSWQELKCDVCNSPYPSTIEDSNGNTVGICHIEIPEESYMTLETVSSLSDHNFQSSYIILLNKKERLKIVIELLINRDKVVIMKLRLKIVLYQNVMLNFI